MESRIIHIICIALLVISILAGGYIYKLIVTSYANYLHVKRNKNKISKAEFERYADLTFTYLKRYRLIFFLLILLDYIIIKNFNPITQITQLCNLP